MGWHFEAAVPLHLEHLLPNQLTDYAVFNLKLPLARLFSEALGPNPQCRATR